MRRKKPAICRRPHLPGCIYELRVRRVDGTRLRRLPDKPSWVRDALDHAVLLVNDRRYAASGPPLSVPDLRTSQWRRRRASVGYDGRGRGHRLGPLQLATAGGTAFVVMIAPRPMVGAR